MFNCGGRTRGRGGRSGHHQGFRVQSFSNTDIGKLPNELLIGIGRYLPRKDQASLASVCRDLRPIGEEVLYVSIDLLNRDCLAANVLWLLHRTLSSCAKLAALVQQFHVLILQDRELDVEVPVSSILQLPHPFPQTKTVYVEETLVASSIIFGIIHNVRDLNVNLDVDNELASFSYDLFDKFDFDSAGASDALGLRNLRSLRWSGPSFHYTLACLPALNQLCLGKHTDLQSIRQGPTDIPNKLRVLRVEQDTVILSHGGSQPSDFVSFTKHFRYLKNANICIHEPEHMRDPETVGPHNLGSYDSLVAAFKPACDTLEEMLLGLEDTTWTERSFLRYCLPISGLRQFSVLRNLEIPYDGLLRSDFTQNVRQSPYRTVMYMLPSTLEALTVLYPKLAIYRWLLPVATSEENLPYLKRIRLHCANHHNDDYGAFLSLHPNDVEHELRRKRNIIVALTHRAGEYWDNMDAGSIRLSMWHASLGTSENSNRIRTPLHKMAVPKVIIWEWIGNQERWQCRYRTWLQRRSSKRASGSPNTIHQERHPRWVSEFVSGRWIRTRTAMC